MNFSFFFFSGDRRLEMIELMHELYFSVFDSEEGGNVFNRNNMIRCVYLLLDIFGCLRLFPS